MSDILSSDLVLFERFATHLAWVCRRLVKRSIWVHLIEGLPNWLAHHITHKTLCCLSPTKPSWYMTLRSLLAFLKWITVTFGLLFNDEVVYQDHCVSIRVVNQVSLASVTWKYPLVKSLCMCLIVETLPFLAVLLLMTLCWRFVADWFSTPV